MVADSFQRPHDRHGLLAGLGSRYEGTPPVYPVGCSGVITHVEALADGRFNIVLRGLERFRIVDEDRTRRYRRAHAEPVFEMPLRNDDRAAIRTQRSKLEALSGGTGEAPER
jgi:Lon protease-like protein